MKNTMIAAATACLVGLSGLSLAGPVVLGPLQIKDSATIHSDGAKLTLENTEYAYFSGDRVVTSSDGSAILQLDDGFALFGPGTDAVATRDQGTYQVDLAVGGVRIAFRRNAEFVIHVADLTVKPFETDLIKAASDEAAVDVAVSIKDGAPSVFVQRGRVNVTSQASGQFQTIAAGELYTAAQSDGTLRRVAIGEEGAAGVDPIIYILLALAAGLAIWDPGGDTAPPPDQVPPPPPVGGPPVTTVPPTTTTTKPPTTTEASPFKPAAPS
jgi:hypothetical protein